MKLIRNIGDLKKLFCFKVLFVIGIVIGGFYKIVGSVLSDYNYADTNVLFAVICACLPLLVFLALLCYAIFKIEILYNCFKNTEDKKGFAYALYFSLQTTILFNPLEISRNKITNFKRVIGSGLITGVDVSKRIQNFNYWFICFAICFCLYFLLANYLRSRSVSNEDEKVFKLLDGVMLLANVTLILRLISYFYRQDDVLLAFYYSDFLIVLIVMLSLAYLKWNLSKKIDVETFEALMFFGWMIAYPISIVLAKLWGAGRILLLTQIIISALLLFIVKYGTGDICKRYIWDNSTIYAVLGAVIPFFTSFFIELLVILNQHSIFIAYPRMCYGIVVLVGLAATGIFWGLFKKKHFIKNWKSIAYPIAIFGIACLWCQIPVSGTYSADLFESANASILISDFLNYGQIPIIEHYGGHMMSGVWEGIIYGLLNKDFSGAIFSPYAGYIATVVAVLFYYFIKSIYNEDIGIFCVLFFPFYESWNYWGFALLMCFGAIAFVRKNTYLRANAFWFAAIGCILYRLDVGFAFTLACITAILLYVYIEKNIIAFKQFVSTWIGWAIIGLLCWCSLCILKGLNPVDRLREFLLINLSNQNWAYSNIGDTSRTVFAWTYIFVPFTVTIGILYVLFSRKTREFLGNEKWILMLIFGFSYFFNYSRGLVRHSLAEENMLFMCVWTSYVFLAMAVVSIKQNKTYFIPLLAIFMVVNTVFYPNKLFIEKSIINEATSRVGAYTETWESGIIRSKFEDTSEGYWKNIQENKTIINRVIRDDSLDQNIKDYQNLLDILLKDDETFVDFINKTFLYSAINRRNPVYVSQSPLQLSGEYTQEAFIKEISEVPVVIMPYDRVNDRDSELLDGFPNLYRYYKVAEYIYQNYRPLCTYKNKYALWCLPERYDDMSKKLNTVISNSEKEQKALLFNTDKLNINSIKLTRNDDASLNIKYTGIDPFIGELQNVLDVTPYIGGKIDITIKYESDVNDVMQMYYTTEVGEDYSESKVSNVLLNNSGTACFSIPITVATRIRLDIPEAATVKITSLKINDGSIKLATYGYDDPYFSEDTKTYEYLPGIHYYELDRLPVIWAEYDGKKSVDNELIDKLSFVDGCFRYTTNLAESKVNGNYLKVGIGYKGTATKKTSQNDLESVNATIRVGTMSANGFVTKYIYDFTVLEGWHEYMFRVSNDYYWYTDATNAITINCEGLLSNVNMEILRGD